jgi:N4-gp56 family major capsid protein
MALNTNLTSTVGFPNAIAIYYDRRLLDRLEIDLFFDQFGDKKPMPKRSGNEIKWTRYTNFAANTTPLTEGTVPNGLTLASTQISATPVQYGDYVAMSDFLITEAIDPVIEGAQDVLSYRAALSLDTVIRNTLDGNVTDQFAGGVANEGLVATNLTAAEVRKAVTTLRAVAARPIGTEYQSIIHPHQSFDLQGDSAAGGWLDINKYTTNTPMLKGEIGKLYGVRFVESPNIFINAGAGAGAADTYHAYMFAKGCYGLVELAGQNLKMYMKQLGSSGVSDPLDQISTVGYKFAHVTKVLDATRGVQMYTLSGF